MSSIKIFMKDIDTQRQCCLSNEAELHRADALIGDLRAEVERLQEERDDLKRRVAIVQDYPSAELEATREQRDAYSEQMHKARDERDALRAVCESQAEVLDDIVDSHLFGTKRYQVLNKILQALRAALSKGE